MTYPQTTPATYKEIAVVVDRLKSSGLDPLSIKELLQNAVWCAVNEMAKNDYVLVIFDSPVGREAQNVLAANGYTVADWKGYPYCRGETRVYLPKGTDVEAFKQTLNDLELTDEYTVINVRQANI